MRVELTTRPLLQISAAAAQLAELESGQKAAQIELVRATDDLRALQADRHSVAAQWQDTQEACRRFANSPLSFVLHVSHQSAVHDFETVVQDGRLHHVASARRQWLLSSADLLSTHWCRLNGRRSEAIGEINIQEAAASGELDAALAMLRDEQQSYEEVVGTNKRLLRDIRELERVQPAHSNLSCWVVPPVAACSCSSQPRCEDTIISAL